MLTRGFFVEDDEEDDDGVTPVVDDIEYDFFGFEFRANLIGGKCVNSYKIELSQTL